MFDRSNTNWLAAVLLAAGLGCLASPWLLGFSGAAAPTISVSVVGVLLALLGLAAAGDRIDLTAVGAMAVGAWSLVAPIILGVQHQAAFWTHIAAGLMAFLAAIAGSEMFDRHPPRSSA